MQKCIESSQNVDRVVTSRKSFNLVAPRFSGKVLCAPTFPDLLNSSEAMSSGSKVKTPNWGDQFETVRYTDRG
jgi:hypothetical protein